MPAEKAKILIIGPERTGKSTICNFLAKFRDKPSTEYKPTVGLRIVEYEGENLNFNKSIGATASRSYQGTGSSRAAVELWDVSGLQRYASCWPAIMKDANGIVFVFNPDIQNSEKELDNWYKAFAQPLGVKDHNCLIFAHYQSTSMSKDMAPKMPKALAKIRVVETSLDNPNQFRSEMDRLIENIVVSRRDAEERQILDGVQ